MFKRSQSLFTAVLLSIVMLFSLNGCAIYLLTQPGKPVITDVVYHPVEDGYKWSAKVENNLKHATPDGISVQVALEKHEVQRSQRCPLIAYQRSADATAMLVFSVGFATLVGGGVYAALSPNSTSSNPQNDPKMIVAMAAALAALVLDGAFSSGIRASHEECDAQLNEQIMSTESPPLPVEATISIPIATPSTNFTGKNQINNWTQETTGRNTSEWLIPFKTFPPHVFQATSIELAFSFTPPELFVEGQQEKVKASLWLHSEDMQAFLRLMAIAKHLPKDKLWKDLDDNGQAQVLYDWAISLADTGNIEQALKEIKTIQSGLSIDVKVQAKIKEWEHILAEKNYEQYYQRIVQLCADDRYEDAENEANKIPTDSKFYELAQAQLREHSPMNSTGKEFYDQCQNAAQKGDFRQALELANLIPSRTTYFELTQHKIPQWKAAVSKSVSQPKQTNFIGGGSFQGRFSLTLAPKDETTQQVLNKLTRNQCSLVGVYAQNKDGKAIPATTATINTIQPRVVKNRVAVVLDSSGSMGSNDPQRMRVDAARSFINHMAVGTQASLWDFGSTVQYIRLIQDFTTDKNALKWVLNKVMAGSGTPLYSALEAVLNKQGASLQNKGAVVVLTDGLAEDGDKLSQVIRLANQQHIEIYAIGLETTTGSIDFSQLQNVALSTGGIFSSVYNAKSLQGVFDKFASAVKGSVQVHFEIGFPSSLVSGERYLVRGLFKSQNGILAGFEFPIEAD